MTLMAIPRVLPDVAFHDELTFWRGDVNCDEHEFSRSHAAVLADADNVGLRLEKAPRDRVP